MSKFNRLLTSGPGDREGRGNREVWTGGEEGKRRDRRLVAPAGHKVKENLTFIVFFLQL